MYDEDAYHFNWAIKRHFRNIRNALWIDKNSMKIHDLGNISREINHPNINGMIVEFFEFIKFMADFTM